MSFFGSAGNDSGYNGWINDVTTDKSRRQIGAALATQPVMETIVGTVVGGILIGDNDNYQQLFWTMGIFVILIGILHSIQCVFCTYGELDDIPDGIYSGRDEPYTGNWPDCGHAACNTRH